MAERTFYERKNYDSNSKHRLFNLDSSADDEYSNETEENPSSFYNPEKKQENNNGIKKENKIDRVRRLSEKLSKIQFSEKENPHNNNNNNINNNLNKLETKFEVVEGNFNHAHETMKTKFNTLKDHAAQIKKKLEEESSNKDDLKRSVTNKLNVLQTKVKSMINEEKEHFKFYADNLNAKLEAELIKCETELKKDDDALLKNINDVKENIKIQEITLKKNHNNKNTEVAIRNVIDSVTDAVYSENEKMDKFKENIYKLLEETSNQIALK